MDRFSLSRNQLVDWVNQEFRVNISKVEQCGTGAVFCLIFDSVLDTVRMNRVNWGARQPYEYIENFKLLQSALRAADVQKNIDIDMLIRGRCQTNLELLQWAYAFYERNGGMKPGYDPIEAREAGVCRVPWPVHFKTWGERSFSENRPPRPRAPTKVKEAKPRRASDHEVADTLEIERDFYYETLRAIEALCQERLAESGTLDVSEVLSILYEGQSDCY